MLKRRLEEKDERVKNQKKQTLFQQITVYFQGLDTYTLRHKELIATTTPAEIAYMKNFLIALALTLFAALPVTAQELTGTLKEIQQSGKIRIGYRTSLPPLSYINNKKEVLGYSIDLCQYIVASVEEKIGRKIQSEYVALNADDRFEAVAQGKVDILCGAATETLSRREIVDFSQHIFVTGGAFMYRAETKLKNNFTGKKIGVVENTTTEKALANLFLESGIDAKIVQFKTTEDGFNSLLDKEIDAFSADQVVLIGLSIAVSNLGDFRILPDLYSVEPIALAVRRNDADFRLVVDSVLANLYSCGEIEAIYANWFGGISSGKKPAAVEALFELNSLPE